MIKKISNPKKFLTDKFKNHSIVVIPVLNKEGIQWLHLLLVGGSPKSGFAYSDITQIIFEMVSKYLVSLSEDKEVPHLEWNSQYKALGVPADLDLSSYKGLNNKSKKLNVKLEYLIKKALNLKAITINTPDTLETTTKPTQYQRVEEDINRKQRRYSIQEKRTPKKFIKKKSESQKKPSYAATKTDLADYKNDPWIKKGKQVAGPKYPEYSTFGYDEVYLLDKVRPSYPIIRPDVTQHLDEAISKLISYLYQKHYSSISAGLITENSKVESEIKNIIWAKIDTEGYIIFEVLNSEIAKVVDTFMKSTIFPYQIKIGIVSV